jgi:hypothetical protein
VGVPLLIFIGFLLVLTATGIVANVRRKRALVAMAAVKQWELAENDRRLPDTFGGQPFAAGHGRIARIVLRGRHNGRAILVIDYEYKTPGSDGDDTHRHWAACVDDLPAALPALEVVPRTRLHRLTSGSGSGVLRGAPEFRTGDPGFDHRYVVTTANDRLAADLLDAQVLRLIASWPDFAWRIEGNRLLTWGKGKVKPVWVETSLNMLVALADTFPQDVWRTALG